MTRWDIFGKDLHAGDWLGPMWEGANQSLGWEWASTVCSWRPVCAPSPCPRRMENGRQERGWAQRDSGR